MSRLSVLLFAAMCWTVLAVGCGDDDTATTDTGTDAGTDFSGDTTEDPVDDATEDPVTDTIDDPGVDPIVDPIVDPVPDQPDMPTGGCESSDECTVEGQECIGGGCVDPVDDLEAYITAAGERPNSFIWLMQLPSLLPDRIDCCFDYDGNPDNGPDNALGDLLPVVQLLAGLQPGELQGYIDEYIENGTVTVLTDWSELPMDGAALGEGDAKLNFFIGQANEDETWETRVDGDGTFLVDPMSLGDFGALIQFNLASIESGTILAGPSTFVLTIPPIPGFFDEGLVLNLEQAQIMADLVLEENGIHTDDAMAGEEGDEYLVGGGRLGGVVNANQILGYVNEFLGDCTCAGVQAGSPVLNYGEEGDTYVVECIDGAFDDPIAICCDEDGMPAGCIDDDPPNCCLDGDFCTYIPMVCDYGAVIADILDTDLNGNEIPDGLSAGVIFGWTGASITGLAVTE